MNIRALREDIDRLDFELLKLLRARMETALKIRKFKSDEAILDTSRERQVIERVVAQSRTLGLLSPEFSEHLFTKIIEESRAIQAKGYKLIGFQGEHGAYSEVAALLDLRLAALLATGEPSPALRLRRAQPAA